MDIEIMKALSFDEVRSIYKKFLQSKDFKRTTISTAYSDTFYLWKHCSGEVFWEVVTAIDFPISAKKKLVQTLSKNSSGDANKLANGYVSHLNLFRQFVYDDLTMAEKINNEENRVTRKQKLKIIVPTPTIQEVEKYLETGIILKTIDYKKMH